MDGWKNDKESTIIDSSRYINATMKIGARRGVEFYTIINLLLLKLGDFLKITAYFSPTLDSTLYKHKEELEAHLYTTQKRLFDYEETITLYDLTNTYFEGSVKGIFKAARGRIKEKRSDAPLVTLAVMLDFIIITKCLTSSPYCQHHKRC